MVNMSSCRCSADCKQMTDRLREVDFAINETVLYLDAYPDCAAALNYYKELTAERRALMSAISEKCGPVTNTDNAGGTWRWTHGPWPWQIDAN